MSYLDANNLMSRNQSAYCWNHLTELALTKVFLDIKSAIDKDNFVFLSLLDLSFDCVDHEILLNRLGHCFGIQSTVFKWLTSYLTGRTQCVHLSGKISFVKTMRYYTAEFGPRLWNNMGYHCIFMQKTHNSTPIADPTTHNLSEKHAFLHI